MRVGVVNGDSISSDQTRQEMFVECASHGMPWQCQPGCGMSVQFAVCASIVSMLDTVHCPAPSVRRVRWRKSRNASSATATPAPENRATSQNHHRAFFSRGRAVARFPQCSASCEPVTRSGRKM